MFEKNFFSLPPLPTPDIPTIAPRPIAHGPMSRSSSSSAVVKAAPALARPTTAGLCKRPNLDAILSRSASNFSRFTRFAFTFAGDGFTPEAASGPKSSSLSAN